MVFLIVSPSLVDRLSPVHTSWYPDRSRKMQPLWSHTFDEVADRLVLAPRDIAVTGEMA
jgi:hypothetical protein